MLQFTAVARLIQFFERPMDRFDLKGKVGELKIIKI